MIITFSDDINTQKAVSALVSKHDQAVANYFHLPSDIVSTKSDKTLILLDLSANGRTQELIEPWLIVENLNKHRLLKNIEFIQIIISDVAPSMPMTTFTWELSKAIIDVFPTSRISVTFSGSLDENPTLVEPPNTPNDKWVIYNIPKSATTSGLKNFGIYKRSAKEILFEGDIITCLNDGDHSIKFDTIRATYAH